MLRRITLLLFSFPATALSCPGADFPHPAQITTPEGKATEICLRIAESQEARGIGLQPYPSLSPNHGMLFRFPAETTHAFWMKGTRIPLSIGFIDGRGKILQILSMHPCTDTPCRRYYAQSPYHAALEMEAGWFAHNNISPGSLLSTPKQSLNQHSK